MEIYTYADFEKHQGHLSMVKADKIYSELLQSAKLSDEDFKEFFEDFVKASVAYSEVRSKWLTLSREEQINIDEYRTSKHNNVIYTLKIINRYMEQQDWGNQWFDDLTGKEPYTRKRIGDFACYVAYVYAVNAR